MKKLNELLEGHPHLFPAYLAESNTVIAVLVDAENRITDCNQAFLELMGTERKPVGEDVTEYLYDPEEQIDVVEAITARLGHDESSVPPYVGLRFSFQPAGKSLHTVWLYAARLADQLFFLGERAILGESDIIRRMSEMNHEITNLSRELTKKNVALEQANTRIKQIMNTDDLTGLANRRHFHELSGRARSLSRRREFPLSVVIMDIDHFKTINDRYGHNTGDRILVAAAELLKGETRNEDIVARWGGEEFVVMLLDAGTECAATFAERVRNGLARMKVASELGETITASFGVAQMHPDEGTEALIDRADQAMYRAKRNGRDQVCAAAGPESTIGA